MKTKDKLIIFIVGPIFIGFAILAGTTLEVPYVGAILAGLFAAIGIQAMFMYRGEFPLDGLSIESFLLDSILETSLLSVEMKDGRVLVGFVTAVSIDPDTPWFKLLPVATGRVSKGRIQLETFYNDILEEAINPKDPNTKQIEVEDFVVLLNKEFVSGVHRFDPDIYQRIAKDSDSQSLPNGVVSLVSARDRLFNKGKLIRTDGSVVRKLAAN